MAEIGFRGLPGAWFEAAETEMGVQDAFRCCYRYEKHYFWRFSAFSGLRKNDPKIVFLDMMRNFAKTC